MPLITGASPHTRSALNAEKWLAKEQLAMVARNSRLQISYMGSNLVLRNLYTQSS